MCELCRISEDKQRNHELRDYTRFVEGDPAPPRKSRKGRNRVRWCKGHVGKEHSWKLLPHYNDGGPGWYYRLAMTCENCQKTQWIDGPLAWSFDSVRQFETKDVPVECRSCHGHVEKIPYQAPSEWKYEKTPGGGHKMVEHKWVTKYKAPEKCPFCGNGKKKIAVTGRETHKARRGAP